MPKFKKRSIKSDIQNHEARILAAAKSYNNKIQTINDIDHKTAPPYIQNALEILNLQIIIDNELEKDNKVTVNNETKNLSDIDDDAEFEIDDSSTLASTYKDFLKGSNKFLLECCTIQLVEVGNQSTKINKLFSDFDTKKEEAANLLTQFKTLNPSRVKELETLTNSLHKPLLTALEQLKRIGLTLTTVAQNLQVSQIDSDNELKERIQTAATEELSNINAISQDLERIQRENLKQLNDFISNVQEELRIEQSKEIEVESKKEFSSDKKTSVESSSEEKEEEEISEEEDLKEKYIKQAIQIIKLSELKELQAFIRANRNDETSYSIALKNLVGKDLAVELVRKDASKDDRLLTEAKRTFEELSIKAANLKKEKIQNAIIEAVNKIKASESIEDLQDFLKAKVGTGEYHDSLLAIIGEDLIGDLEDVDNSVLDNFALEAKRTLDELIKKKRQTIDKDIREIIKKINESKSPKALRDFISVRERSLDKVNYHDALKAIIGDELLNNLDSNKNYIDHFSNLDDYLVKIAKSNLSQISLREASDKILKTQANEFYLEDYINAKDKKTHDDNLKLLIGEELFDDLITSEAHLNDLFVLSKKILDKDIGRDALINERNAIDALNNAVSTSNDLENLTDFIKSKRDFNDPDFKETLNSFLQGNEDAYNTIIKLKSDLTEVVAVAKTQLASAAKTAAENAMRNDPPNATAANLYKFMSESQDSSSAEYRNNLHTILGFPGDDIVDALAVIDNVVPTSVYDAAKTQLEKHAKTAAENAIDNTRANPNDLYTFITQPKTQANLAAVLGDDVSNYLMVENINVDLTNVKKTAKTKLAPHALTAAETAINTTTANAADLYTFITQPETQANLAAVLGNDVSNYLSVENINVDLTNVKNTAKTKLAPQAHNAAETAIAITPANAADLYTFITQPETQANLTAVLGNDVSDYLTLDGVNVDLTNVKNTAKTKLAPHALNAAETAIAITTANAADLYTFITSPQTSENLTAVLGNDVSDYLTLDGVNVDLTNVKNTAKTKLAPLALTAAQTAINATTANAADLYTFITTQPPTRENLAAVLGNDVRNYLSVDGINVDLTNVKNTAKTKLGLLALPRAEASITNHNDGDNTLNNLRAIASIPDNTLVTNDENLQRDLSRVLDAVTLRELTLAQASTHSLRAAAKAKLAIINAATNINTKDNVSNLRALSRLPNTTTIVAARNTLLPLIGQESYNELVAVNASLNELIPIADARFKTVALNTTLDIINRYPVEHRNLLEDFKNEASRADSTDASRRRVLLALRTGIPGIGDDVLAGLTDAQITGTILTQARSRLVVLNTDPTLQQALQNILNTIRNSAEPDKIKAVMDATDIAFNGPALTLALQGIGYRDNSAPIITGMNDDIQNQILEAAARRLPLAGLAKAKTMINDSVNPQQLKTLIDGSNRIQELRPAALDALGITLARVPGLKDVHVRELKDTATARIPAAALVETKEKIRNGSIAQLENLITSLNRAQTTGNMAECTAALTALGCNDATITGLRGNQIAELSRVANEKLRSSRPTPVPSIAMQLTQTQQNLLQTVRGLVNTNVADPGEGNPLPQADIEHYNSIYENLAPLMHGGEHALPTAHPLARTVNTLGHEVNPNLPGRTYAGVKQNIDSFKPELNKHVLSNAQQTALSNLHSKLVAHQTNPTGPTRQDVRDHLRILREGDIRLDPTHALSPHLNTLQSSLNEGGLTDDREKSIISNALPQITNYMTLPARLVDPGLGVLDEDQKRKITDLQFLFRDDLKIPANAPDYDGIEDADKKTELRDWFSNPANLTALQNVMSPLDAIRGGGLAVDHRLRTDAKGFNELNRLVNDARSANNHANHDAWEADIARAALNFNQLLGSVMPPLLNYRALSVNQSRSLHTKTREYSAALKDVIYEFNKGRFNSPKNSILRAKIELLLEDHPNGLRNEHELRYSLEQLYRVLPAVPNPNPNPDPIQRRIVQKNQVEKLTQALRTYENFSALPNSIAAQKPAKNDTIERMDKMAKYYRVEAEKLYGSISREDAEKREVTLKACRKMMDDLEMGEAIIRAQLAIPNNNYKPEEINERQQKLARINDCKQKLISTLNHIPRPGVNHFSDEAIVMMDAKPDQIKRQVSHWLNLNPNGVGGDLLGEAEATGNMFEKTSRFDGGARVTRTVISLSVPDGANPTVIHDVQKNVVAVERVNAQGNYQMSLYGNRDSIQYADDDEVMKIAAIKLEELRAGMADKSLTLRLKANFHPRIAQAMMEYCKWQKYPTPECRATLPKTNPYDQATMKRIFNFDTTTVFPGQGAMLAASAKYREQLQKDTRTTPEQVKGSGYKPGF